MTRKTARKKKTKGRRNSADIQRSDLRVNVGVPIPASSTLRATIDALKVGESCHMHIDYWDALRNAASNAKKTKAGMGFKNFTVHRNKINPEEVGVWRVA